MSLNIGMIKLLIEELQSLLEEKGYQPQIQVINDYTFIVVENVFSVSIHKKGKILYSRYASEYCCRCEFAISKEGLINIIGNLPEIPTLINIHG